MQILIENILVRAYYESSIIGEALANGSVRWGRLGLLALRLVKSHADGYRLVSNGLGHHNVDACCRWRKPIRNLAASAVMCVCVYVCLLSSLLIKRIDRLVVTCYGVTARSLLSLPIRFGWRSPPRTLCCVFGEKCHSIWIAVERYVYLSIYLPDPLRWGNSS